jgi:hypothetical protein
MIPLQLLKSLFATEEPLPPHIELEHAHWDRGTQTWRLHDEPEDRAAA